MDKGDVDAIGAHCQFPYCNQLDFLPFRCESCKGTYCLNHRTETTHKCPKAGTWTAARRKNSLDKHSSSNNANSTSSPSSLLLGQQQQQEMKCALPACKTQIHTLRNVGVHCASCNRQYCLKHRFRDEHDCANLVPIGARPGLLGFNSGATAAAAAQTEKARLALARLRTWGRDKQSQLASAAKPKSSSSSSSSAARVLALNELKKAATGDAKLAPEKRLYLHVEASAESTTSKLPRGAFFYDKDWTVGRMLDAAARSLQVQNVNNRGGGEEERLRVFHVEGGRLLDFAERLAKVVVSGNTLVLLRGVGPPPPSSPSS